MAGHTRRMSDTEPPSDPIGLPRPAMWPPGATDTPFSTVEDDTAPPETPGRGRLAWVAVGLVVVGVVLLGLAVALTSWVPAVAGVVLGLAGMVLAYRARIFEDVSLTG